MPLEGLSLLQISSLSSQQIDSIFAAAKEFSEKKFQSVPNFLSQVNPKVVGLLFFEPSTRTRFSFEVALHRLGHKFISLSSEKGTSMSKGESIIETIETIRSMGLDGLVVRSNSGQEIENYLAEIGAPVINAGVGALEHPTQALLDAYTIQESLGDVANKKIVFVGDVAHSRVANSNLQLLSALGAEVAYCCPESFSPGEAWSQQKYFSSLDEACKWAEVVVGLRIQKERHDQSLDLSTLVEECAKFKLDNQNLKSLDKNSIIMHPGPFVPGEDLELEVLKDPRCRIRTQVSNGVYVRAALMGLILGVAL